MRYEIKRSNSTDWESLTTESLASELAARRLQPHWKIRSEWESQVYSVEELCELQSAATAKRKAAQAKASLERTGVTGARPQSAVPRRLFYFVAFYLIATFLWRTLTVARELAHRAEGVYLAIGLDVLCVVGLIGLRMKVCAPASVNRPGWAARNFLFAVALTAGLGLLAIRLNGNHSWWSGHLRFDPWGRP